MFLKKRFNCMIDLKKYLDTVDGFLTDKEGGLLFKLAQHVKRGSVVEIGSWKGKSTVCLALGSREGSKSKVFAIDPHTGSPEHQDAFGGKVWTFDTFKENIKRAQVEDIVVPIVKTSGDAVNDFQKDIGLIFIDGAHEYEPVKKDFLEWEPKVLLGGIIAFHDTVGWAGPRKVVEEYLYNSSHFKNVRFVDSITYATKVDKNNFFDRIQNRYMLYVRNISEYVRGLSIPKPIKKIGKIILESIS